MKAMHRLIVTSETYKLASEVDPALTVANSTVDPDNTYLWHFRLQRLEAEPIWDSILAAAGDLDLTVGGPSFDIRPLAARGVDFVVRPPADPRTNRRAAYMIRGYSTSRDVMPNFLQAFDVDDGRVPCPLRTRTVTAPQALFLMNSDVIDQATDQVRRAAQEGVRRRSRRRRRPRLSHRPGAPPVAGGARPLRSAYLADDPARLKGFAWLLFNLDEFIYVR